MKSIMHIIHIIHNSNIGGVQKFVEGLIPASNECEHKDSYSVLFTSNKKGELYDAFLAKNVGVFSIPGKLNPFRPDRLYRYAKSQYPHIFNILIAVQLRRINPSLVHCHLYNANDVAGVLRACISQSLPLVWTIHGEAMGDEQSSQSLQKEINNAEARHLPITIIYVGARPQILNRIRFNDGSPIIHIPSGIDVDKFRVSPTLREKNRSKFGFGKDNFLIGYVGRLSYEKGVDVLLSAAKHFLSITPNGVVLIAGIGPEQTKLTLQAQSFANKDQVHFIGQTLNVQEFLSMLDIYIQPSRTEGIPLSVIEAMAAGLPVIATNVGGLPMVVEDGISGILVPTEDPISLVNAVNNKIANKDHRHFLSKNAEACVHLYDISTIRKKNQSVYKDLLDR